MHAGGGLARALGGVCCALGAPQVEDVVRAHEGSGLGIEPSAALLQAGVVAAEHLSFRSKVWMWEYAEARVRHPLLPNTKAGAAEWERVLSKVAAMVREAPAAAGTATRHGQLRGQLSVAEGCAREAKAARQAEGRAGAVVFDAGAAARVIDGQAEAGAAGGSG